MLLHYRLTRTSKIPTAKTHSLTIMIFEFEIDVKFVDPDLAFALDTHLRKSSIHQSIILPETSRENHIKTYKIPRSGFSFFCEKKIT